MKNYIKTNIGRAWFSRLLQHPARKTEQVTREQYSYSYKQPAGT